MHPLKTNMRLATAAAAQARGGLLSQEEEEQLRYAEMLIDVSKNRNSPWCQVIEEEDENISKLGYDTFQNKSYWSIDKFVRGGHSILWFDSGGRELDPDKNPSNAVHAIRAF